jgi:hypothetical protein
MPMRVSPFHNDFNESNLSICYINVYYWVFCVVINMNEEKLPISGKLKIIKGVTLFKTNKWWSAVALIESFGRKQVAVYLWGKKGDQWKRRQKFVVRDKNEWSRLKEEMEKLVAELS